MKVRWRFMIIGMEDKVSDEDSDGKKCWRRCGTTGMDTAVEEMRDGKRRDVGRRR